MTDILKADIFFFITSVAVLLLTTALLVAIFFAVRTLQEAREIIRDVRGELRFFRAKRQDIEIRVRMFQKLLASLSKLSRPLGWFDDVR